MISKELASRLHLRLNDDGSLSMESEWGDHFFIPKEDIKEVIQFLNDNAGDKNQ